VDALWPLCWRDHVTAVAVACYSFYSACLLIQTAGTRARSKMRSVARKFLISRELHELLLSIDVQGPAPAPRVLSPLLKIRLQSPPVRAYPPMGNCCGSAATVPSEPHPGPPIELRPSAPVPLQPVIKESSAPSSSRPPSRPRSHSSVSRHEPTQHTARSSQDPIPRSRTKSAPQVPQTFNSSSPQDPRPRARSVVQSKRSSRSDSRTTGPGETN
jgi:hypothetical protein